MAKRPSRYEKMKQYENSEEYQKDVVYELRFIRKGTRPTDPDDVRYFPRIILHGNPKDNPVALEDGIFQFQQEQKIDDWKSEAEKYEIISYWFG